MIDFGTILPQIGINVSSNAIYDLGKLFARLLSGKTTDLNQFKSEISSCLNIENASVFSEKLIEFLAKNGNISISGTCISSNEEIIMNSSKGTEFILCNNSFTDNKKSQIIVGLGASITAKNGAGIEQKKDGTIILHA